VRSFGEPVVDQLGLVCTLVVHDNMDVEIGKHVALDLIEELAELLSAVARHAFADNGTGLHVKRGEQRGCPVAGVVVSVPLDLARPHR
jgi:hypothetical protein